MTEITYLDFDLLIEPAEAGYRARVLNSPAGQASTEFTLPFADMELENFLLRLGQTRNALVRNAHLGESEASLAPKIFGQRLFAAVFDNEVQACLRSSQDTVRRQGGRLRLRLHLTDVPELAALPWEYLYHASLNRFFALSAETPLVRYLDLPDLLLPVTMTAPLRLLVIISSPVDYPQLDVEQEWARLRTALADLEARGIIILERLEDARLPVLQQRLRQQEYHILHFIGHGGFDSQTQEGLLLLEGQAERGHPVSGHDLGTLLHDHRSLRLVVLNACQGARSGRNDPFAGVAQSLVQQRMPAVVAMQFEITDQAAIVFAQEFYSALADNYPVDAALTEARKAIFAQGNKIEWGTPVLYMRAPDGRVFDIKASNLASAAVLNLPSKVAPALRQPLTQLPAPLQTEKAPISPKPAPKVTFTLRDWRVWIGVLALALVVFLGFRLSPLPVTAPPVSHPATVVMPVAPVRSATAASAVNISPAPSSPERIRFAPGATSAILKGTLEDNEQRQYTLRALAGQTLIVAATADTAMLALEVKGVSDGVVYKKPRQDFAADFGRWQGDLPITQDYLITLALGVNTGVPANYTLNIRIPPLATQPTANPTVTPMPSAEATVTVVSTNLAACSEIIDPRLASISQPDELGCATGAGQVVWAAWEEFERGYMLWRSDTDRAYAIFADGSWQTIDERWDNKAIPSHGNPPAGLQAPTRGFGYAWGVRDDLFNRLGWAKGGEKGFCALIQSFQHGFILKSDTTEFCQDGLYNQARSPDWTPILFAATDTGQWWEP